MIDSLLLSRMSILFRLSGELMEKVVLEYLFQRFLVRANVELKGILLTEQ